MPLTVRYASQSDSRFHLTIPDEGLEFDHCTALVGRSGAGKSTLVKALAGPWHQLQVSVDCELPMHTTPRVGLIERLRQVLDRNQSDQEDLIRTHIPIVGEILAVHQDPSDCLLPRKSLYAHKHLIQVMRDEEHAMDFESLTEALGIDFNRYRNSPPEALSGGQQRRLALALTLAFRPALIIIDEALGALDFRTAQAAMAHIIELTKSRDLRVLLVSHDLYTISVYSSSAIVVNDGSVTSVRRNGSDDSEWLRRLRGEFA